MKKIYNQPEWKLSVVEEDVITSSGDGDYSYGSNDMFNSEADSWEW